MLPHLPALSKADVAGLLEARRALEPRVAMLAGLHGTEQDFEGLFEMVEEQCRAPSDWALHAHLDKSSTSPLQR